MPDKTTSVQVVPLHLGHDTEYDTPKLIQDYTTGKFFIDGCEHQRPVSSQFFCEGLKLPQKTTLEQLQKVASRWELGILHLEQFERGLGIIFDSRDWDAGEEYQIHFGKMVSFILEKLYRISSKKNYELHLWTLYSNAEIANLFPTLEDLKTCMRKQGDVEKRSSRNMTPMPIQKSFYLDNYRRGLPPNCKLAFRDVRHLFYKPSLEALGKQIGLEKLEHPDWEKVSAGEWLESDPVAFCEYGVRDAMIPCVAAVDFLKKRNDFIHELISKGIVSLDNVEKLLDSISVTAAGISDRLVKAHWQHKGLWDGYKAIVEEMEANYLPSNAQRTKGGLNKYFISDRPEYIKSVDIYDVKSQYANSMRMLKIPSRVPEYIQFPTSGSLTASEVVLKLTEENAEQAYLYLDWELPEGCSEWQRPVVAYDSDGDGCTLRKAEKQWIFLCELQLIAHIHPDALIKVQSCMVWKNLEVEGRDYYTCREFIEAVTESREEYKQKYKDSGKTDISAYLMQDTIKLIGNGTAGKFAQYKAGLSMEETHETLMKGGMVSNTANGEIFRANITYSLAFNIITAMARTFTAYSAWLNKAAMVVTDSMVISSGTFKNPSEHLTEYEELNKVLLGFEFDQEYSNVDIVIFKERDYAVFSVSKECGEHIENSIEHGSCLLEDSEFKVHKVAKRGWRPRTVSDSEVESFRQGILSENTNFQLPSGCNDWKVYLNNVEFFKEGFPRMIGLPLVFQKNLLLGAKEFLLGCGVLNSRQTTQASIGSHNLRYQCDDLLEFKRRKLVKEKCRSLGYADALHCQLKDPTRFAEIEKRCKPKPQVAAKLPQNIRKMLGVLAASGVSHFSQRALARKFGIAKSTVNRLAMEVKESKLDLSKFKLDEALSLVEQWFEQ